MIFVGIEKEGQYKGLKTLFVAGNHDIVEIQTLATKNECSHIYLGAGRTYSTTLSINDIVRLLTLRFKLSYEVTHNPQLPEAILCQINVIYSILKSTFPIDLTWLLPEHCVKIEDEYRVIIMPMLYVSENTLETLTYDKDMYEGDVILKK